MKKGSAEKVDITGQGTQVFLESRFNNEWCAMMSLVNTIRERNATFRMPKLNGMDYVSALVFQCEWTHEVSRCALQRCNALRQRVASLESELKLMKLAEAKAA